MKDRNGGFVYVQTNDADNNEVVVFERDQAGRLQRLDSYRTGGRGSGTPHLPSQGSVVLDRDRLLVTNAGSDEVTLFSVDDGRLDAVDRVASGGATPRSVSTRDGDVYVLNTGGEPNVAVFERDGNRLMPVEAATRSLGAGSDPAQVAVSPDGRTLVVTDRAIDGIHVFAVDEAGSLAARPVTHPSCGTTPYGFDLTADGLLVVTEAAGGQVGKASASSYRLDRGAQLLPVSGTVSNTRSEVCWAVIGNDGRTVFVTNFGDGTISTYTIGHDGRIELLEAVAATTVDGQPGIRDEALTADGSYLYALHADTGQVFGWEVGEEGALAPIGSANGLPLNAAGLAAS